MDVSSIGPSGLDPFSAAVAPQTDEPRQPTPPAEAPTAPLEDESGTHVDTSA